MVLLLNAFILAVSTCLAHHDLTILYHKSVYYLAPGGCVTEVK